MRPSALLVLCCLATPVFADPNPSQVQLDLGLSVITVDYEHPLGERLAVAVGAGIFSTWFAPIFEVGDKFMGAGAELRVTRWFRDDARGLYVTPYGRIARATGTRERDDLEGKTTGFTAGVFVGYAFKLSAKLDARVGAGAQYLRFVASTPAGDAECDTPFIALDAVLGYRL